MHEQRAAQTCKTATRKLKYDFFNALVIETNGAKSYPSKHRVLMNLPGIIVNFCLDLLAARVYITSLAMLNE